MMLVNSKGEDPLPGKKSVCGCGGKLVAKCGEIKIWHWAHLPGESKDDWHEPETKWHLNMKNTFRKNMPGSSCEVAIKRDGILHVADFAYNGKVIEFQHSPISIEEMKKRELFYNDMCWFLDKHIIFNKKIIHITISNRFENDYFCIRYSSELPKSFMFSNKPIIFDDKKGLWFVSIKRSYIDRGSISHIGFLGRSSGSFIRFILSDRTHISQDDVENIIDSLNLKRQGKSLCLFCFKPIRKTSNKVYNLNTVMYKGRYHRCLHSCFEETRWIETVAEQEDIE